MGTAFITRRSGGGAKINGLIDEYVVAAGNTISAGDFVEYLLERSEFCVPNFGTNEDEFKACLVDENHVFVALSDPDGKLNCAVYTFDGLTITASAEKAISTSTNSAACFGVTRLDDQRVFVAYPGGTQYYLNGVVCSVVDGAVTVNTSTRIVSGTYYGRYIGCAALTPNRVLIVSSQGSAAASVKQYFSVCDISDVTVSAASVTLSTSDVSVGLNGPTVLRLDDTHAFVLYAATSDDVLTARAVEVSDSGITAGGAMTLSTADNPYGEYATATVLSPDRVFVAYGYADADGLRATVLAVSGVDIFMSAYVGGGDNIVTLIPGLPFRGCSATTLPDGRVYMQAVQGTATTACKLYRLICEIDDVDIAVTRTDVIAEDAGATKYQTSLTLDDGRVFNLYGANNVQTAYIETAAKVCKKYAGSVLGVSKTGGTEGQTIQVYVPPMSAATNT